MITKLRIQNRYPSLADLDVELYVPQKNGPVEAPSHGRLLSPWRLGLDRSQNPFYTRNNTGWTGRK